MNNLIILEKPIRQFGDLYCLNDVHKASGGLSKHEPNRFLRNQQTQDLIAELSKPQIWGVKENQQVIKNELMNYPKPKFGLWVKMVNP